MSTPKQRRLRGKSEPVETEPGTLPSLLDDRFDDVEGSTEFTRWRRPGRDDE